MNSFSSKMKFILGLVTMLVVGVLVGRLSLPVPNEGSGSGHHGSHMHGEGKSTEDNTPTTWTCSMHPQFKLPKAGQCPICFMDLIPLKSSSSGDEGPRELKMSEASMALAEVETVKVIREDATVRVDMVGKMAIDTTRIYDIAMLSDAEIRTLYVGYKGIMVKKGDHLAELYSPEVYAAGQDYLVSLQSSTVEADLLASSLKKLQLLGVPSAYIQVIEKKREVPETYTMLSPVDGFVETTMGNQGMWIKRGMLLTRIANMDSLWAQLDAYESDLAWVRYGQSVILRAEALPGQSFEGVISFIPPQVDDLTRTIKVRVKVDNADLRLKPGMFVSATVEANVSSKGSVVSSVLKGKWISPMHPEIVKDEPGSCDVCGMALVRAEEFGYESTSENQPPLLIPASSVLITGKRAVVYVRLSGESPSFQGREVELGPRAGHRYVVLSGLKEGELVVSKGNFKIDSALQIQGKPSMMSMAGDRSMTKAPVDPKPSTLDQPKLRASMVEFFKVYMKIHKKLTEDDFEGISDLAVELKGQVERFDASALNAEQLKVWSSAQKKLESSMEHLHHYRDIESFREAFKKVSLEVIAVIQMVGHDMGSIQHMSCSMAEGHWIQLDKKLLNPYYGQSMLRCGDVEMELPPIPVAK